MKKSKKSLTKSNVHITGLQQGPSFNGRVYGSNFSGFTNNSTGTVVYPEHRIDYVSKTFF